MNVDSKINHSSICRQAVISARERLHEHDGQDEDIIAALLSNLHSVYVSQKDICDVATIISGVSKSNPAILSVFLVHLPKLSSFRSFLPFLPDLFGLSPQPLLDRLVSIIFTKVESDSSLLLPSLGTLVDLPLSNRHKSVIARIAEGLVPARDASSLVAVFDIVSKVLKLTKLEKAMAIWHQQFAKAPMDSALEVLGVLGHPTTHCHIRGTEVLMREIVMSAFSAGFTLTSTAKQYVYGVDYFSLSDTAFLVECLFAHYSARQDSVSTARCTLRPTVSSSPAPSGLSTAVCKAGVRLLEQLLAQDTLPFHHLCVLTMGQA